MFGNVSWGREASPPPHLPLKDNLHPAGQEAPARRHGALGLTPAATRETSKGAVTVVRCAGWALGAEGPARRGEERRGWQGPWAHPNTN